MPVPIICKSKGITASSLFCPAMKRKHTGMFFTLYTAQKLLTVLYLFMFHLSRSFSNQDLVLDALWQERGSPVSTLQMLHLFRCLFLICLQFSQDKTDGGWEWSVWPRDNTTLAPWYRQMQLELSSWEQLCCHTVIRQSLANLLSYTCSSGIFLPKVAFVSLFWPT